VFQKSPSSDEGFCFIFGFTSAKIIKFTCSNRIFD
jgi:hypothetical protein